MPELDNTFFGRSVILMCLHSDEGAMGFVINKSHPELRLCDVFDQLAEADKVALANVEQPAGQHKAIYVGGPVEQDKGFVVHSNDVSLDQDSLVIADNISVTATIDALVAVYTGNGPENNLVILGYAGWAAEQLEEEIARNSWLVTDLPSDIIFHADCEEIYALALDHVGINIAHLSRAGGSA